MESQFASSYGLEKHGIKNTGFVYWNLSTPLLYEEVIRRREGRMAHLGPLVVRTGEYTGRSPNDKFVVKEPSSADKVWWGPVNKAMARGAVCLPAKPAAGLSPGERPFHPGLLRRGRSRLPPAHPGDHRDCLA